MNDIFEAFRNCISDGKCTNRDCPYKNKCQIANGTDQYLQIPKHLALDVLNELKKLQEEAKPKRRYWRPDGGSVYECGFCNAEIGYYKETIFCKRCGKKIKWG